MENKSINYICKYNIKVKKKSILTETDFFWDKFIHFESEVNDDNELKTNIIKYIKEKTIADLLVIMLNNLEDNVEKRKILLGVGAWLLEIIYSQFDEDFILKIKSIEQSQK